MGNDSHGWSSKVESKKAEQEREKARKKQEELAAGSQEMFSSLFGENKELDQKIAEQRQKMELKAAAMLFDRLALEQAVANAADC